MSEEAKFKETIWIKFWYSLIKTVLGPFIRWVWIKKVEGLKNIPEQKPCIIAANHSSYFDFLSLAAISKRRIYFLAAEKFFKGKIWGPLVRLTGQIKVERKSKDKSQVYNLVLSAIKQGYIIGVFPEGTRSRNGEIHQVYGGIARFVLATRVPVVPVGISGAFEILPPHKKIPQIKKNIEIKIGQSMEFGKYYDKEQSEKVLQDISDEIMLKIAELSGKKYQR